jgi:hypothetical protein
VPGHPCLGGVGVTDVMAAVARLTGDREAIAA